VIPTAQAPKQEAEAPLVVVAAAQSAAANEADKEIQQEKILPRLKLGPEYAETVKHWQRTAQVPPVAQGDDLQAVQEFLKRVHLWPPDAQGNAEVQLGAWWATRLGMLLAVIGLVSFSVYMQLAPWIRFCELAAAALAITLGGWRLEKHQPQFGRVVFAGGLAAIYFTSFAAHMVPATRILADPQAGAAAQFLTALALLGCALVRASEGLALLTVGFGYVAAGFAIYTGLEAHALVAGLVISAITMVLHLKRHWVQPYLAAIPLTHLLYWVETIWRWLPQEAPPPPLWLAVAWPAGLLAAFVAVDFGRALDASDNGNVTDPEIAAEREWRERLRRWALLANSSLAIATGWLVMNRFYHAQLHYLYFSLAIVMGASAAAWHWLGRTDAVAQAYGFKCSALVGLGVVAWLQGLARWVALAVESGVVAFAARRTRLVIYLIAALAVWFWSAVLFVQCNLDAGLFNHGLAVMSLAGVLSLLYAAGTAALFTVLIRWFAKPREDSEPLTGWWLLGVVAGLMGIATQQVLAPAMYAPLLALGVGLLIAAATWALRGRACYVGFGMLLLLAHGEIWCSAKGPGLALNTLATVGITLALAIWMEWQSLHGKITMKNAASGMHALWMFTLQMCWLIALPLDEYLPLAGGLAIIAVLWAGFFQWRGLAPVAWLPLSLMIVELIIKQDGFKEFDGPGAHWLGWLVVALAYGFVVLSGCWGRYRAALGQTEEATELSPWMNGAGLLVAGLMLRLLVEQQYRAPVFALVACLFVLPVVWWARRPAVKSLSWMCNLYVVYAFWQIMNNGLSSWAKGRFGYEAYWQGLLFAGLALLFGIFVRRMRRDLTASAAEFVSGLNGALALMAAYLVIYQAGGAVRFYITALWGVVAIVMFIIGLVERAWTLRAVAFAGLGLALLRVFAVDVRSTFDRIIAFFALGGVLLIVGFLYHKWGGKLMRKPAQEPQASASDNDVGEEDITAP
jgi:hypothetical protein